MNRPQYQVETKKRLNITRATRNRRVERLASDDGVIHEKVSHNKMAETQ